MRSIKYHAKTDSDVFRKSQKLVKITNMIIPTVALFMFAFIPTSKDKIIYGTNWTVFVWLIVALFICMVSFINNVNYRTTFLLILPVLSYLLIATLIMLNTNIYARVSLARIAPVVSLLTLSSITIRQKIPHRYMSILLDLFFIIMILWNSLILFDNNFIKEFTKNYYSQYYDLALTYSMIENKPVMSFGVHTYASYFYMLTFYLSYVTAKRTNKFKYFVYCFFSTIYTIFLTSNSSLIYASIMMAMLFMLFRKKPIPALLLTLIIFIALFSSFGQLIERYYTAIQSGENGFVARYFGKSTIFSSNLQILQDSIGIGFCILDNMSLKYTDSGYMIYLTMGHIPLLIGIYLLIFKFLKNNISKPHLWFILFIVFSFEVALPATFQYRFFFAIVFVIYYLQSLEKADVIY